MDFYLVSYDIPGDRRRTKMANLLQDYGQRVQDSVFEVWLDAAGLKDLQARLSRLVNVTEDSVRVYRLCAACQKTVAVLGVGREPQPPGPLII